MAFLSHRRKAWKVLSGGGGGGAVVFDATAGTSNFEIDSLTWSHTCTGSDLVLFVGVAWRSGQTSCTSVTYNGVAMTELWDVRDTDGVGGSAGYILANPATGANNVVVTWPGTNPSMGGGSVSFTNCDTASPNGTPVSTGSGSGGSANGSVTVGSVGSNDFVVDSHGAYTATIAVGADQVSRQEFDNIAGDNWSMFVSTQPGSLGGVMSATYASTYWAAGAVAIKPKP